MPPLFATLPVAIDDAARERWLFLVTSGIALLPNYLLDPCTVNFIDWSKPDIAAITIDIDVTRPGDPVDGRLWGSNLDPPRFGGADGSTCPLRDDYPTDRRPGDQLARRQHRFRL
jgi:hypothetical protein